MKTSMAIRMTLVTAMLLIVAAGAAAQLPVPWNENRPFWYNPDAVKKLNLTYEQQQELNNLVNKANQEFLQGARSKFTEEQWKQIQSLRANHSDVASEMGLEGPDALHVAAALKVNRAAAQDYVILINRLLTNAVHAGAQYLQLLRVVTKDPCKDASEVAIQAVPNLDSTQLKFTLTLEGTSYAGNTCPAATANLKQGRPVTVTATYPCAVTSQGVDLAPDCKISSKVTMYEY
jgi:hypothetical protein